MTVLRESPWYQEIVQEGLQKGLLQGRQEGRQEGIQKGLQQGLVEAVLHLLRTRFDLSGDAVESRRVSMASGYRSRATQVHWLAPAYLCNGPLHGHRDLLHVLGGVALVAGDREDASREFDVLIRDAIDHPIAQWPEYARVDG